MVYRPYAQMPAGGEITIAPATVLPDILGPRREACLDALLPDGVPGEGLVFVGSAGTPFLADVDSGAGCHDALPDFGFTYGTCAGSGGDSPVSSLPLDRPVPFPICVRRVGGGAASFDYTVLRVGADAATLSGAGPVLVAVPYDRSRLPRSIGLQDLPSPGPYVLKITVGDGTTPVAFDLRLFLWSGEPAMFISQTRGRSRF
jgi:hypothetical protein